MNPSQATSVSGQFTFILEEFASGDNEAFTDTFEGIVNEGQPTAEY